MTGYCLPCNVARRDIFRHRASATHIRRSSSVQHVSRPAGLSSSRKVAVAAAFRALRDYDHQYDDVDPGNSPEWNAEYARA